MDLMLPILIALIVALVVWSVTQTATRSTARTKKKLAQRLSIEGRLDPLESLSRPITLQLEVKGLPAALARRKFIQVLHKRLLQAYPEMTLQRFLVLVLISAVVMGGSTLLLSASPLMGLALTAVGAYVPFLMLAQKRATRQRMLANQLPDALDFLSRILKAGHSFSTGLQMMSDELPKPLATEFRRCYDQHSLGQSLDEALKDTSSRIESTDFAFFVTAVLIQRQTGGDLSEVLRNISGMIRSRVRLAQQVKAKTAEGRFTGYILVCFPAIMFLLAYFLNPDYGGKLLHGQGLYLLGLAFGLQMLGLYFIKKITTFKV